MAPLVRVLVTGTSLEWIQQVALGLEQSSEVSLVGITMLEDTEALFHKLHPEAVLITYNSQTPDALGIISRISRRSRVLLFGIIQSDDAADGLLAGAWGVLPAEPTAREIVDLLGRDEGADVICPDHVTYALFGRLCSLRASRLSDHFIASTDLSFQEVSILRLLGAGLSNKQIAQESHLSVHTVKNHVHRILKRLALQNRLQAADYFRTSLLPSEWMAN